jgi:molybdopterin synthase sulfur carrier subunit
MTIRVLFFAKIKESLGVNFIDLKLATPTSVEEIRNSLLVEFIHHKNLLTPENSLVAVNQEIITENIKINQHDEIAFFPPVTGG